jgi:hypothetical protein
MQEPTSRMAEVRSQLGITRTAAQPEDDSGGSAPSDEPCCDWGKRYVMVRIIRWQITYGSPRAGNGSVGSPALITDAEAAYRSDVGQYLYHRDGKKTCRDWQQVTMVRRWIRLMLQEPTSRTARCWFTYWHRRQISSWRVAAAFQHLFNNVTGAALWQG